MTHIVPINELELGFLGLFRMALSAEPAKERLDAIYQVRHEVISARLAAINETEGHSWTNDPHNAKLVEWVARTAAERDNKCYELHRLGQRYEEFLERRLNVAEHIGKLVDNSIKDGEFQGVQTKAGILYQVTQAGKTHGIRGAKDKDTVRECWMTYRGIVHLGIAMDLGEDQKLSSAQVLQLAELIRRRFSETRPRGTKEPYVPPDEQISFVYKSSIKGPRFRNRGLPFYVED